MGDSEDLAKHTEPLWGRPQHHLPIGGFAAFAAFVNSTLVREPELYAANVLAILDVELHVTALGSWHVGLSPGQFLEFLLGWTTLDLGRDDALRADETGEGEGPEDSRSEEEVRRVPGAQ